MLNSYLLHRQPSCRIITPWKQSGRFEMADSAWQVFELTDLMKKVEGDEPRFFEFLRVPTLSSAVYRLPAGAKDMQAPHLEDEVYVVVEGRARLRISGKEHDISPGTILFVRATAEHSFFDIEEDLVVLAFFGRSERLV
jgi:mannose-6-phosphate isomerase-like protein (cupin superfamily)